MLRLSASILLLALCTAASASPMIEMKNVKAGEGCGEPRAGPANLDSPISGVSA